MKISEDAEAFEQLGTHLEERRYYLKYINWHFYGLKNIGKYLEIRGTLD